MAIKHLKGKSSKEGEVIYIKDATFVYPSVQSPKAKHQSEKMPEKEKRHYEVQAFITEEDRAVLEDEVLVNKQFFEALKDKNKKRKVKYPAKNKDGEPSPYAELGGLHGVSLTLNEYSKKGSLNEMLVVMENEEGETVPFTGNVGNGSKGHIKLWGYRNQEGLLNIQMKLMKVTELVEYESSGGTGNIVDDELGVSISREDMPKKEQTKQNDAEDEVDEFDDSAPFDDSEEDEEDY